MIRFLHIGKKIQWNEDRTLVEGQNLTFEEKDLERYLEMKEKGTPLFTDGIFYRVVDASFSGRELIALQVEPLEGKQLFEVEQAFGKPYKNLKGYFYELSEESIHVEKIIPIVATEFFERILLEDSFEEYLENIEYPEGLEDRITYDEEYNDFHFGRYKWLVFVKRELSCGVRFWKQAYVDLNNINVMFNEPYELIE